MRNKEDIAKGIVSAHIDSISWDEGDMDLLEANIIKGLDEIKGLSVRPKAKPFIKQTGKLEAKSPCRQKNCDCTTKDNWWQNGKICLLCRGTLIKTN